jgi:hypothetical protein
MAAARCRAPPRSPPTARNSRSSRKCSIRGARIAVIPEDYDGVSGAGRHRLKLLICVLNDGAYGAELHKLRADGLDDTGSIFGRTDLAAIAKGFGLRGATVTDLAQFAPLFEAYRVQGTAEIWNIRVSGRVVSPSTRRGVGRGQGQGKM